MKFAIIDDARREPAPGLTGSCPGCDQKVIAKCGEQRLWHWAHKGKRTCDPWWEPETEWHRAWKNLFPEEWQEVPMRAANGELHIADVRTPAGMVLEFQHSAITPDERRSREAFYDRMLWIVDGLRLKNDRRRMDREFNGWRNWAEFKFQFGGDRQYDFPKRWADCGVPVLLDFDGLERDAEFPEERAWLAPSVIRDEAWWHMRGALPDPLIYLMPSVASTPGTHFAIRRETFISCATSDPDQLDPRRLSARFVAEREEEMRRLYPRRRNRRDWRF